MEDFVSFDLAKKLKEKGFREKCFATYDKDGMLGYVYYQPQRIHTVSFDDCLYYSDDVVVAPTISQVLKWLREEKEIMVFPIYSRKTSRWYCSIVNADSLAIYNFPLSDSYEQAVVEGIKFTLDNLI